jgi:hypothetical protein
MGDRGNVTMRPWSELNEWDIRGYLFCPGCSDFRHPVGSIRDTGKPYYCYVCNEMRDGKLATGQDVADNPILSLQFVQRFNQIPIARSIW